MVWYEIAKPSHVSVLRIGARDPGGAEWSHRRCNGSVIGRISISLTSREHLTLAVTSHGLPRGTEFLGRPVCPWAYK